MFRSSCFVSVIFSFSLSMTTTLYYLNEPGNGSTTKWGEISTSARATQASLREQTYWSQVLWWNILIGRIATPPRATQASPPCIHPPPLTSIDLLGKKGEKGGASRRSL